MPGSQSPSSDLLAELARQASGCIRCPLAAGRTQVVFGEGAPDADLLVVGEGPGRDEDLQGRPFVGRSGQLLDRLLLEEVGLQRAEVYIANVVKCRPPGNRDPLPEEIEACRPYLARQIELLAPKVVLTLGNFSTKLLLETTDGINKLRGRAYPFGPDGAVLVPTFHPAAALRGGGEVLAKMRADFVRAKQALAAAAGQPGAEAAPASQPRAKAANEPSRAPQAAPEGASEPSPAPQAAPEGAAP